MIAQRKISTLSNRLARDGGRRIPEAVLERDYCLSWFLVGLSRVELRDALVFKGGTALKCCYFGDYRFSEDLGFTLCTDLTVEAVLQGMEDVYEKVRSASGITFHFSREDRNRHTNSHTFYLAYEGPLPSASPREVKVDITINERIVCPIAERAVLRTYTEFDDIPEDNLIRVYSLEEIAIEKIIALTDRARNEPRDLYDIWYLMSENLVNLGFLIPEIESKLAFRSRAIDEMEEEFEKKEGRFKKLWSPRLGSQMTSVPRFDHVFRSVRRELRAAGLINR